MRSKVKKRYNAQKLKMSIPWKYIKSPKEACKGYIK